MAPAQHSNEWMNDSEVCGINLWNKPWKDTSFHSPSILISIIQTAVLHMFTTEILMDFFEPLQRENEQWSASTGLNPAPAEKIPSPNYMKNAGQLQMRQQHRDGRRTGQMAADGREWTSSPLDSGVWQDVAQFRRTSSGTGAHWPHHCYEENHQNSRLQRSNLYSLFELGYHKEEPWAHQFEICRENVQ